VNKLYVTIHNAYLLNKHGDTHLKVRNRSKEVRCGGQERRTDRMVDYVTVNDFPIHAKRRKYLESRYVKTPCSLGGAGLNGDDRVCAEKLML